MFNLIKMDVYRLFHTRSFKVGLIFSALLPFVAIACLAGFLFLMMELMKSPESAELFTDTSFTGWITDGVALSDIILTGFGVFSILVSTVLTSIFINTEQESGYIKNIAGQISSRQKMIVSKLCTIAVINLAIFVIYTVASAVAGLIFFQSTVNSNSIGSLMAILGTKLLLYIAIDAIILFICTLTKSKALSVAIGVIFGIGITGIVYSALSSALGLIWKDANINLANFTPDGMNSLLSINSEIDFLIKAILVAVIYIVVFVIASAFVIKKRDIN